MNTGGPLCSPANTHTEVCALPALDPDTGLPTLPPEDEAGGMPVQEIFPGASSRLTLSLPGTWPPSCLSLRYLCLF